MSDAQLDRTKINGYPIIASKYFDGRGTYRAGHTILVDRGEMEKGPRYVVANLYLNPDGKSDGSWHKGDYIDDFNRAQVAFINRWRRAIGVP